MCLGIPSRVIDLEKNLLGMTFAKVEAGGTVRRVRMDYAPMAEVGDYVMVQMGFAVSVLDESEAGDVFDALDQLVDLSPIDSSNRPAGSGTFSPSAERGEGSAARGGPMGTGAQGAGL